MKYSLLSLIVAALLIFSDCYSQKNTAGYYSYKTECLGVEMDGSQTVKAWGSGRNRPDAIEQAKKNAVRDVLFNGIREGKPDCEKRPVISEVNAQVKYEEYFNKFFADGGDFKNFVSLKDERLGQRILRDRKAAHETVTFDIVLRIQRTELKQKMITDGILK